MSSRLAMLVASAALLAIGACSSDAGSSAVPPPGAALGPQLHTPVSRDVLDAALVDSSGHPVKLASLRGKILVVSDLLTLCQETCPLDTANVVAAAQRVSAAGLGRRVEFLSVTVDPERDTQARLAAYRRLYAPAPANWLTLTGSSDVLNMVWDRLGVYRKREPDKPPAPRDWLTGKPLTYDVTHSDVLFFIDGQGRERFLLFGAPHVAAGAPIPPQIKEFMSAAGRRNLSDPGPQAWTLSQELQVISWLVDKRI